MSLLNLETIASEENHKVILPLVLHTRVVTGEGGGPEKTILNSPRFLPELGYQSVCAYMRPKKDAGFAGIRKRAEEWSAPLFEVDDTGPFDLGVFRRLLNYCREKKVAIWHGHDYKSNLIGLVIRRYWPMKLVTTAHGWGKLTWRTRGYFALERWSWRGYDKVICVSKELHDQCLAAGVHSRRCVHIPNAIDSSQFCRSLTPIEAKIRLGLPVNGVLIGAVGRLSKEKGFDVLLMALFELRQKGANVYLAIAGEGDERAALASLIRSLGLEDRVLLLGFRPDTLELFQAFDVFALSSHREGLPNVVLEAMALDVPVVATSVGSVREVLGSEHPEILVPPGDSVKLAEALALLVRNQELRELLAARGRERIKCHYSFARRMERVADVYNDVMGSRATAGLNGVQAAS